MLGTSPGSGELGWRLVCITDHVSLLALIVRKLEADWRSLIIFVQSYFPCSIPLFGPHFLLPLYCGPSLSLSSIPLKHFTPLHRVPTELPIIVPSPIFYPHRSDPGTWLKLAKMPHPHDSRPGYITQDRPEDCLGLIWGGRAS